MFTLSALLLWLLLCLVPCHCPGPYDEDLRIAVLIQVQCNGWSYTRVGNNNGIDVSTVSRWMRRYRETQSILPDVDLFGETRGRNCRVTRYDVLTIVQILLEDCTLYQDEVAEELIARDGSQIDRSTVSRWLKRIGHSRQRLYHVEILVSLSSLAKLIIETNSVCKRGSARQRRRLLCHSCHISV